MNPDNGPYSSDARRHCIKIMKDGGQGSFSSSNAETIALSYCDLLYTLRDALNHIPRGSPINQTTFAAALDSLGSVPSGNLATAFFGPNHHDAVADGWDYRCFPDCQCFHYAGSKFRLS